MERSAEIVGGGFAGLHAARRLRRAPVDVTVLDRTNHHLFQPLLYQVATASITPSDVTAPIRHLLRKQRNTEVVLAHVQEVDVARRVVIADEERPLAVLLGETAESAGVSGATKRMLLAAIGVKGVPRISVEEALWTAAETLLAAP
jgi:NADH dehydrogenase FAD-containing subunit